MYPEKLITGVRNLKENAEELFTTIQVAELFKVSAQTVSAWRKSGTLKAVIIGAGHPRFRRSAIDELIAANESARVTP